MVFNEDREDDEERRLGVCGDRWSGNIWDKGRTSVSTVDDTDCALHTSESVFDRDESPSHAEMRFDSFPLRRNASRALRCSSVSMKGCMRPRSSYCTVSSERAQGLAFEPMISSAGAVSRKPKWLKGVEKVKVAVDDATLERIVQLYVGCRRHAARMLFNSG